MNPWPRREGCSSGNKSPLFVPVQDVFGDGPIPYPKREFLTDDDNDDKNDSKHNRANQSSANRAAAAQAAAAAAAAAQIPRGGGSTFELTGPYIYSHHGARREAVV